MSSKIKLIKAREILSAGSTPTIETKVILENGVEGRASVPFGTSSGKYEAISIKDKDENRYNGLGALKMVENVNEIISKELVGMDVVDQKAIDSKLLSLDNSPQKENLGGNAILSISLASARTASKLQNIPLYSHIRNVYGLTGNITKLPKPMMVVIEGGVHADNSTDFQEFSISPTVGEKVRDSVRAGIETYFKLKNILKEKGFNVNVGLEGAYAPSGIKSNSEPLTYITQAIKNAGYEPGKDVGISLDPASSEFFSEGKYVLSVEEKSLTSDEFIEYYKEMVKNFPIISIEDALSEDDWDGWVKFNTHFKDKILNIGDDLTVTSAEKLKKAIELDAINSILIKPNQVGTLSETMDTILLAKENNMSFTVSHRGGGETTDTFIIDLAAATGADFVKVGPSRGERVVKYNRLMEIGDELGL